MIAILCRYSVCGYGIISVASHLVGSQIKEMIDSYCWKGKRSRSHTSPSAASGESPFLVSNPVPVKYALNQVVSGRKTPLTSVEPDLRTAAAIKDV